MAQARKNDLLGRLMEAGEEAIQRLSDVPGGDRILGALNATRDRVDELQRRVRGLEELDRRVAALERKVDKLARGSSSASTTRARKSTSSKKS
jgi:hypothetical protein